MQLVLLQVAHMFGKGRINVCYFGNLWKRINGILIQLINRTTSDFNILLTVRLNIFISLYQTT